MIPKGWLDAARVLAGLDVSSPRQLVQEVAREVAPAAGIAPERVTAALETALRAGGASVGSGVAIPHTRLGELTSAVVCLVTLRRPLSLPTPDAQPLDIFFFVLSPRDPHGHLLLLAHLARLIQEHTLRDGLRQAATPEEARACIRLAESPEPAPATKTGWPTSHALVLVSARGEQLVDAILVDLVDRGFEDACVLEAQSLREAVTREVPLFTGFRDIFGDPGGRRVVLLECTAAAVEGVVQGIRHVCEEHGAEDARVSVLPVQLCWDASHPRTTGAAREPA